MKRAPFLPLALLAGAGVGTEVALTRYFALAHYSEYGYWVLSIAMAGFALSGVALALFRGAILGRAKAWLDWLPIAALAFGALGWWGVALNPFNALELQHPQLWSAQLWNIGLFYLALFPYFFSLGLYIGLCFSAFEGQVPKLYAWDLAGAGLGALLLLLALGLMHPFHLIHALLLLPFLAALVGDSRPARYTAFVLLVALQSGLWLFNPARISEYKPLSYALNTEGARTTRSWNSPRGSYQLVEAFTERLDLDLSNNASLFKIEGTPRALGLYRDGSRLAALPREAAPSAPWFDAALEGFPYQRRGGKILLLGGRGGFKSAAARARGGEVSVLESDPELAKADPGAIWAQPLQYLRREGEAFDLVDVADDFAVQERFALSAEVLRAAEERLAPDGLLSVGVSIQEFPAYGARLVATLASLFPGRRVCLYHSAWSLRALVYKQEPSAREIEALEKFCARLSFDLSWAAGRPRKPRGVWNDLPSMGWPGSGEAGDALAAEAALAFAGKPMQAAESFDLRPATVDRPFFFSTLRLGRLREAWMNLSLLPREELGLLVNLAVLAQALLLGLLTLALPLPFTRLRLRGAGGAALYFSCLGLGYFFFEVALIEKATPYLRDRALAFSLVLAVMLVFSGLGSAWGSRFDANPSRAMRLAFLGLLGWACLAWFALEPLLASLGERSAAVQALALSAALAPLAFALGLPFSAGLGALRDRPGLLPWAWALNGAFSVLAPPLAFLLARSAGYSSVAGAGVLVYFLAWLSFPKSPHSPRLDPY